MLELSDQALVGRIPGILMNETVKVGRNFKGPQAQPQGEHQPDRRSATADASMLRFAEKLHANA
jgi:hypothetical protein